MPHIFLIENQDKIAQFVKLELSEQGYQVSVAHNGRIGLTRVRETNPDLVILDGALPGFSGLEVCRRLRTSGSQMPIIFVTAIDEVSHHLASLEAGANDYVVKPFQIDELLAKIQRYLQLTPVR